MMKKLLFSLIIFSVTSIVKQSFSQTNIYHPFPDSNATWRVDEWSNPPCNPPSYYCGAFYYTLTGQDTIIGGYTYTSLGIRQDKLNKKVYVINYNAFCPTDTLLYDFSLNIGDTLKQCSEILGGGPFYIMSIDSVLVGSQYRKRFNVNGNFSLIEGVGSTSGLFGPFNGWIGGYYKLTCFLKDSSIAYGDSCSSLTNILNNDYANIIIAPNPATIQLTIDSKQFTKGEIEIFDVLGKKAGSKQLAVANKTEIDISFLERGVYYLKISSKGKSAVKKFVKM